MSFACRFCTRTFFAYRRARSDTLIRGSLAQIPFIETNEKNHEARTRHVTQMQTIVENMPTQVKL